MVTKKKSKAAKWIIAAIILIAVFIIGRFYMLRSNRTTYDSVTAKTGNITTYYSFAGNVEAKNRQTIMAEKAMQISEINVGEGDTVSEGDILIKTTTGDEITAEQSGEIVNLNVEVNQQVMAGIKLMDIVDYNDLEVQVKVDEYDISAIEPGKETTVSIGALNKEIKGTVASMSKEGEVMNGVTFFMAVIDLEPDESLRVGMSAEVKMTSANAAGIVTLPLSAMQFDENNSPFVYTMNENGRIIRSNITTGINDGTTVEIKSGITDGETVYYPSAAGTTTVGFGLGRNRNGNNDGGDR